VNVRLWPFLFFAYIALAAVGLGATLARLRATWLISASVALAVMIGVDLQRNDARGWAQWNYEGLQRKADWPVFRDLVLPLDGTPGRLANDLHESNNRMGSSRIFEVTPHLIDKPVIEGGIVNSAIGSMYSYYVQCESSKACAGFPTIVTPTTFNFTNATRHLERLNVKHFIARSDETKRALADMPEWRFLRRSADWELYELDSHDGAYVTVPAVYPCAVLTDHWKTNSLEWLYVPAALDQLCLFVRPGDEAGLPPDLPRFTEDEFRAWLGAVAAGAPEAARSPGAPVPPHAPPTVTEVGAGRIRFSGAVPGLPYLVKCSYFPNWKVRGARRVFMASPASMLVFAESPDIELYYGYVLSDHVGRLITAGAACVCLLCAVTPRVRRRRTGVGHEEHPMVEGA
jgi:hypothetical protein